MWEPSRNNPFGQCTQKVRLSGRVKDFSLPVSPLKTMKTLPIIATSALVYAKLYSATAAPIPVTFLRQQADVVAIATLQSVTDKVQTAIVQLNIVSVLQGQLTTLNITAQLPPPQGIRGSGAMLSQAAVGTSGIWFLKRDSSGYEVLPLCDGPYNPNDIFIPVQDSPQFAASGTLDQQLLAYQILAYRLLPHPTSRDDSRIMASLVSADPQDSLNALAPLVSSPVLNQHFMGIAAQIRLGSADGLSQLAGELESLRASPRFFLMIQVTESFPPQQTPSAVAALTRLISLHSDVPELDLAAATALIRIAKTAAAKPSGLTVQAVLPAMVSLLDSKDLNAQMRAAGFLGYYTLFAEGDGNIRGSGIAGPFATADTRQFTPREEVTTTAAQYAQFWKVWWSQNYSKLGFAAP